MLGSSFMNHYKTLSNEILNLSQIVHKIFEYSVSLSLIPIELSIKLNLSAWKNFVTCVDECLSIASMLCDKIDKFNGDGLMHNLKHENISNDVIRRIVIDFILAAGDTTAISTQWVLHLLAKHPSVQHQLHADLICNKSTNHNESINNIIRETLRLYPIAPFITRYLPNDIELHGFSIPTKSLILMSVYSSSRNSDYFPQPNEFQPNRWTKQNNKYSNVVDPFASIPFAMGARSCIGRKLAQTQMYLTISQIVKNYHIEVEKEVKMVLKLITVPEEPIKFYFSRRKQKTSVRSARIRDSHRIS